jgi:hypothetical protein
MNNKNSQDSMLNRSILKEPNVQYTERVKYITVSSLERNTTVFPNPGKFNVTLQNELKNVVSFELIQAILPNVNNILNEPYLLLKIDEMDDVMESNDRNIADSFAIVQLAPAIIGPANSFINTDKRTYENTTKEFITPKASLAKLSITMTDISGGEFDFRTVGTPLTDKSIQITFIFKAIVLEKTRTPLNVRSVY